MSIALPAPERKQEKLELANLLEKNRVKIERLLAQEKPELAKSLEKNRVKVWRFLAQEKLSEQLAVSLARAETRFLRQCPDGHTKRTIRM